MEEGGGWKMTVQVGGMTAFYSPDQCQMTSAKDLLRRAADDDGPEVRQSQTMGRPREMGGGWRKGREKGDVMGGRSRRVIGMWDVLPACLSALAVLDDGR